MALKKNLLVDAAIFVAFLLAAEPELTGLPVHEWLSLAFAAAALVHLLLHWNWIVCVGAKLFKKLLSVSRLNFVLDVLLFVAVTAVMTSGILISRVILPAVGITPLFGRSWQEIHSVSANLSLALTGLHFALHWKWMVTMVKRYVFSPIAGLFNVRNQPQPIPVEVCKEER